MRVCLSSCVSGLLLFHPHASVYTNSYHAYLDAAVALQCFARRIAARAEYLARREAARNLANIQDANLALRRRVAELEEQLAAARAEVGEARASEQRMRQELQAARQSTHASQPMSSMGGEMSPANQGHTTPASAPAPAPAPIFIVGAEFSGAPYTSKAINWLSHRVASVSARMAS